MCGLDIMYFSIYFKFDDKFMIKNWIYKNVYK